MSYAFRNPFVDGKIWTPEGGVVNLSFIGDNKLPYVSSVEIDIAEAMNFELSVVMNPTYKQLIDLIDNQPWIRLGNTIGIRWGYNDGNQAHISDWIYGFIIMPEPDFGEDITITIKANGVGWKQAKSESTRVWGTLDTPKSLEEIFKEMASKWGVKLVWEVSDEQMKYFQTKLTYLQAGLTNYQFIERYCRECAVGETHEPVVPILRGKEIVFKSSSEKDPKPSAEFHYYGKPDTSKNIFPMTNFNCDNMGPLFLPHRTYSAFLQGANTDPNADTEVVASAGNSDAEGEGMKGGSENNFSGKESLQSSGTDGTPNPDTGHKYDVPEDITMEAGKIVPVIIDAEEQSDIVQGVVDNIRQQDAGDFGISVSFDTLALPALFPMDYVRLKGVTAFFSTVYRIKKMHISINEGGADMTVNAIALGIPEGLSLLSSLVKNSIQGETKTDTDSKEVEAKPQ